MVTILHTVKDTELGLQVYLAAIYSDLRVTRIQNFKVVNSKPGREVIEGRLVENQHDLW